MAGGGTSGKTFCRQGWRTLKAKWQWAEDERKVVQQLADAQGFSVGRDGKQTGFDVGFASWKGVSPIVCQPNNGLRKSGNQQKWHWCAWSWWMGSEAERGYRINDVWTWKVARGLTIWSCVCFRERGVSQGHSLKTKCKSQQIFNVDTHCSILSVNLPAYCISKIKCLIKAINRVGKESAGWWHLLMKRKWNIINFIKML